MDSHRTHERLLHVVRVWVSQLFSGLKCRSKHFSGVIKTKVYLSGMSMKRNGPEFEEDWPFSPSQPELLCLARFTARRVCVQVHELHQICELPARCFEAVSLLEWIHKSNTFTLEGSSLFTWKANCWTLPWRHSSRLPVYKKTHGCFTTLKLR